MKTTPCPHCHRPHALSYYRDAKGRKLLVYTCDRVAQYNTNGTMMDKNGGQSIQMRYITQRIEVDPFIDGLDIPEEWSPGWARKQQKKQELQLALMVERKEKKP